MNDEHNPYLKALEQTEAARKQYEELKWRLHFLTSLTGATLKEPTSHEILKWHQQPH